MTDTEIPFKPTPPRSITVPLQPSPQTVSGVLCDSGFPSDPDNITDLPPDFGWMTSVETLIKSFTVTSADTGLVSNIYPGCKFQDQPDASSKDPGSISWHWIPFSASRWWMGSVRLRFMAIKPPRIPGKLLIRYIPDVSDFIDKGGFTKDNLKRGIKYEWDLGLSSECSIDIPAYNYTSARPTWITRFVGNDVTNTKEYFKRFRNWLPHLSQISLGVVRVEIANPIVPGNIFPDSIRILVFHSFPGSSFHVATDPRCMKKHFFMFSKPESIIDPTPYP